MPTVDVWQQERHAIATESTRVLPSKGVSYWLSGGLALSAAATGVLTFFVPGILTGPAAMNGSARGTALVVLVLAVPILVLAMLAAYRGSVRAVVVWLGAAAYLLYNAFLFVLATPFNKLFLIYVAMFSLALWTVVAVLQQVDLGRLRRYFVAAMPVRGIATYIWVVVALNTLIWMRGVLIGLSDPNNLLAGTGLATDPLYIQDLAFWLPMMAVAAFWLWHKRVWGYLVAGAGLTFWVIESVGVAVDQWFGHTADPASPVAGAATVWAFAALAAIGCVPLYFYHRNVRSPAIR